MVDDDANIRRIAQLALTRMGPWDVFVAGSGDEALTIIEEFRPDAVLLDVMMPGMDGPTLLRKIRDLPGGAELPVIFITAKVQIQEVDNLMRMGVAGIISKPFDVKSLSREVSSIVQYWELQGMTCGRS